MFIKKYAKSSKREKEPKKKKKERKNAVFLYIVSNKELVENRPTIPGFFYRSSGSRFWSSSDLKFSYGTPLYGCFLVRRRAKFSYELRGTVGGGKAVASANDKSYEPSKQKGVIYKEESRSRLCPASPLLFIQEGAKAVRYTRHKHTRVLVDTRIVFMYTTCT